MPFMLSNYSYMDLPKVSVIVINYNGKHYLRRCLSSLDRTNYPRDRYDVLLVDNCSSDDSVDFVETNFPWVKLIPFKKNYGFGKGNNKGVEYAIGDYVVFLNNDTKVTTDWLIELVGMALQHAVPICASKTLFMNNHNLIHYGGAKFTVNGRSCGVAFSRQNCEVLSGFYTGYPCAAAMLIRRDVFFEIGEFDEDYFACLDDTDLGWRAWLFGYRVLYCPSSVVYHVVSGSTGMSRISPIRAFHGTKNALMNILKNFEPKQLVQGLFLAGIFDFVEFLLLTKRRDIECSKNKVKAYFWVVKNLRLIIKKRRVIQNKRCVSDKWLLNNGLMASLNEAVHEYLRLSKLDSTTSWTS